MSHKHRRFVRPDGARPLTRAQMVEAALTLAAIDGAAIRKWNSALAHNRTKRAVETALRVHKARLVTHNQAKGRGAHYRFEDGSAIGLEIVTGVLR